MVLDVLLAFVAGESARDINRPRVSPATFGNRQDADDAIQEALVSIWRELPRLRATARFDAWADRILVNACRLVLRRRTRRSVRQIKPNAGFGATSDAPLPSHEDSVIGSDAFDRVFESLDVDARAIITLRYLEDRPLVDIALALAIPEGTVKSRLFRARGALDIALGREAS